MGGTPKKSGFLFTLYQARVPQKTNTHPNLQGIREAEFMGGGSGPQTIFRPLYQFPFLEMTTSAVAQSSIKMKNGFDSNPWTPNWRLSFGFPPQIKAPCPLTWNPPKGPFENQGNIVFQDPETSGVMLVDRREPKKQITNRPRKGIFSREKMCRKVIRKGTPVPVPRAPE